jgi:hypothetical protein
MQIQVKSIHIIGICLVVLFGFILNNGVDARSLAKQDANDALENKRQEQSALRKRAFHLRSNDDEGDRKYEQAVRAVLAYAQHELAQDKRDDSYGSGYGSGSYSPSYGSGYGSDSGSSYGSGYGSGSYSPSYGSGYGSGSSFSARQDYGSGYGSGSYSPSYGSGYGSGSSFSARSENGAADELDDDESDALAELVSRKFKQQHANKRHWWNK